jgi:lipoyl(octanoyl) transferase
MAVITKNQIQVTDLGVVDYESTWQMQKDFAELVISGEKNNTLFLLQHPSVYTAGRRTLDSDRPTDKTPVIDVDRGGKITWHGIGQLVGYPIVKLRNPTDVVGFV